MNPIVIRTSPARYVISLIGSLVVLSGCLLYLPHRGSSWLVLTFAVVFGLCAVASALKLVSSRTRLLVDDSGIWDSTWGVGTVHWTQVTQVFVRSEGKSEFLCFRLREPDEVYSRLSPIHRKAFDVMRASGFGDLFLETAGFGVHAEAVVEYAEKKLAGQK